MPRAQDAGALTREQVVADPTQARQRNVEFDAGEKVDQQKLYISIENGETLKFVCSDIERANLVPDL